MSAVEKVLAEHWVKSWSLGPFPAMPGTLCACGEWILPLPGDEDARVRRSQAHAAHVAQMLAAVLADVWDEGYRFWYDNLRATESGRP